MLYFNSENAVMPTYKFKADLSYALFTSHVVPGISLTSYKDLQPPAKAGTNFPIPEE